MLVRELKTLEEAKYSESYNAVKNKRCMELGGFTYKKNKT